MGTENKGRPSGTNKEEGRGMPATDNADHIEENLRASEKYTDGQNNPREDMREMNPNRNTDKDDATNAGGYKQ